MIEEEGPSVMPMLGLQQPMAPVSLLTTQAAVGPLMEDAALSMARCGPLLDLPSRAAAMQHQAYKPTSSCAPLAKHAGYAAAACLNDALVCHACTRPLRTQQGFPGAAAQLACACSVTPNAPARAFSGPGALDAQVPSLPAAAASAAASGAAAKVLAGASAAGPVEGGNTSRPLSAPLVKLDAAAAVAQERLTSAATTSPAVAPAAASQAAAGATAVAVPSQVGYSTGSYWNHRYAEKSTHFDWFYSYSALQRLIRRTCGRPEAPVLHVGCGNSELSARMAEDGFQQVVNVDISPVVVEQMALQHPDLGQRWEAADCRTMPQYDDGYFGAVVDKGTLDAVLCCHTGQADGAAYINEVHRLLSPGDMFLLISLGQPRARLPLLHVTVQGSGPGYLSSGSSPAGSPVGGMTSGRGSMDAHLNGSGRGTWEWERVEVYLLPKPSVYLATEASLLGKSVSSSAQQHDKDEPIAWLGPYAPEDIEQEAAAQQLALHEYFFAYACTKACS